MNKFPTWSHELGGSSFTPTLQSNNVFSCVVIKKRAKGQNIFRCLLNNVNKNKNLGALLFPATENWMSWIVGGHNFNLNFNHFVFQYKPKFLFRLERVILVKCKALMVKKQRRFVVYCWRSAKELRSSHNFFYWSVNDIVVMIFRRKRGKLGYFDKQ